MQSTRPLLGDQRACVSETSEAWHGTHLDCVHDVTQKDYVDAMFLRRMDLRIASGSK